MNHNSVLTGRRTCELCYRQRGQAKWDSGQALLVVRVRQEGEGEGPPAGLAGFASSASGSKRRSTRGRKSYDPMPISITRGSTVCEVKRTIMAYVDVPPLFQRLYYGGRECLDEELTMEELDVCPGDSMSVELEVQGHPDQDAVLVDGRYLVPPPLTLSSGVESSAGKTGMLRVMLMRRQLADALPRHGAHRGSRDPGAGVRGDGVERPAGSTAQAATHCPPTRRPGAHSAE
jgi:hypothetical protein